MLDFLGYMLFSGFEYCGIIFFILSIFSSNIKYFKIEFIIAVTTSTIISYIMTILEPSLVILIVAPYLIFFLKYKFQVKLGRSVIVVFGGLVIYIAMQWFINKLALHYDYLKIGELNDPFAVKSYIMQTLSSTVAITISMYLRIFNSGFGFSLRSNKIPYMNFIYITILAFVCSILCVIAFTTKSSTALFNITGVSLVVSSIVIFFLSYKRDDIEYS